MNEIVEKVLYFIERDGLNNKTRKREIVYKRAYLMHVLRCQEYTFHAIGEVFNRDHATALYQCKMVKQYLYEIRDEIYINHIQEYLEEFEGEKFKPEYWDLTYDILNCNNTYELKLIKQRIHENKYGNNDND
tara:strand:+ start:1015 stop:1410 length:396 start_codon:yes stop_codon:yes gene_type:complete